MISADHIHYNPQGMRLSRRHARHRVRRMEGHHLPRRLCRIVGGKAGK